VFGTVRLPRIWLTTYGWVRGHHVHLLRLAAVLTVLSVTALAGYMCHGLIGPPG
jgi:hypothetical protein